MFCWLLLAITITSIYGISIDSSNLLLPYLILIIHSNICANKNVKINDTNEPTYAHCIIVCMYMGMTNERKAEIAGCSRKKQREY